MSHVDVDLPGSVPRSRAVPSALQGVLAVATTSTLDAASTVAGLSLAPVLVESNPLARALFAEYGVLQSVVLISVLLAVVVVGVTEAAVRVVAARTRRSVLAGSAVRFVGYGTPSLVSLYAATNNVVLLVEHAPLFA
ncbi:hypothetical protein [Halorubellus sp. PRR65]|uniref:hypothetical protein n=1 Tax=Halorubellus sp. PRR65 TaxID=3098148 RepID=UPI002B2615D8|nr:hypothetical protein [Halorubellus sp. PRR65]